MDAERSEAKEITKLSEDLEKMSIKKDSKEEIKEKVKNKEKEKNADKERICGFCNERKKQCIDCDACKKWMCTDCKSIEVGN